MRARVIPIVQVEDRYVVKTQAFRKPTYVGDPINTVKIFNEKQADELVLLDVGARTRGGRPDLRFVESVVSEAFMPVAYGGGVERVEDAAALFALGVEKVVLNTALVTSPRTLTDVAERFGAQAVVANIDVRRNRFKGEQVWFRHATAPRMTPERWAAHLEARGAGEILLTAVDREGTRAGYALDLVKRVSNCASVPVVANAGAGRAEDLAEVVIAGASAAAAGTMFTFHGPRRAVLITYPSEAALSRLLS